jgi:hypothetical protein
MDLGFTNREILKCITLLMEKGIIVFKIKYIIGQVAQINLVSSLPKIIGDCICAH